MPIIQSFGSLKAVTDPAPARANLWPSASSWRNAAYATIYTTQPNVRTCVDFLARNIAQLGYHVFRRVSDTDRMRLVDHDLAQWLGNPNPSTSRYRLFESLVGDLGIYFNAYWLKLRQETPRRIFLVRLPPEEMTVEGGLLVSRFVWTTNGQRYEIAPSEIVYFNGFNPLNPLMGISPLETLRRILAEEAAAVEHRELYWRNASRMEGVIERPKDAPRWTPTQKTEWRTQWQERYHGAASAGSVPVLEDGMTFKQTSFTPRDSEYSLSRKLTREEVAAEYHIPLPMVGILNHATFSNIKEQHKQLYADCLGPWLEVISEEIERQLLPESSDTADVYGEFNIADKLKGSFEEQANALRLLVGRPIMTANEGRARLNLPSMKDDPSADELAAQQGGPAAPIEGSSAADPALPAAPADDSSRATTVPAIVRAHWTRQASRLTRIAIADRAEALNHPRCQLELTTDLAPLLGLERAAAYATRVTDDTYTLLFEGKDAFADRVPPRAPRHHEYGLPDAGELYDDGGRRLRLPEGIVMRRDGLKYEHILSFALEHPWAITPTMLHLIAGTLARRIAGEDVDPAQVASALVARSNRVPTTSSEPTVAVIPIYGVIAPRTNLFSEFSGGATFEGLTAQLHEALAIPTIKTIVFDVDSPGGNVAGATEFAREVMEARTRVKVIAQANHLLASAAYWAVAGATGIVASPSALVGSIGVYTIHDDVSEALAKLGVKRDVIAAGKYKGEGIDGGPLTTEGREHIAGLIGASYDRFVGDVAKGRGVKSADVRKGYGEGRVLNAAQALEASMIDRIATLGETLKRFMSSGASASGAHALDGSATTDDPSQESQSDGALVAYEQRLLALERSAVS